MYNGCKINRAKMYSDYLTIIYFMNMFVFIIYYVN